MGARAAGRVRAVAVWLIFTRNHSPTSLLVRAFCWSAWSHVGIVVGDDVLQVTPAGGVHLAPLRAVKAGASRWEMARLAFASPEKVTAIACSQIGKRYDWRGVFGLWMRRKLQREDRWFCSELIAWAADVAGEPVFRARPWRITPRDLYMVTQ